ncbi:RNA-binding protein MEX3D [Mantella aurantiaca]
MQQTKGVLEGSAHGSGASRGGSESMQELRGEEEPGGAGPRGPHEGDIKGESGPRGPHKEHLNHEALTSTGLDSAQCKADAGDVQECARSLGPLDPQHPQSRGDPLGEACPMGPRDPVTLSCLRPADVEPEQRDAPEGTEHPQHHPEDLYSAYTLKPLFPTDPPLRAIVQPSLYHRDKAGHHGAREAAFLPSCVQLFPHEPIDEDFPLMLDPISSLGLHEDPEGEETGMEGPGSDSSSPEPGDLYGGMAADHLLVHEVRRRGVNMTEGVPVPTSEHVAEIVGRQGCKIKALRAKTNTYIKTPVRGEEPVFIVTGRKEDVEMAKREILAAAEHFSIIRATRNKMNGIAGAAQGPPNLPGQTTIQVRVPYRVVGLVVGPKGATIKRIQQNTHTYIVTPSRDKEPIFEVTGMPENVDRAREEIEAHITMRTGSLVDNHPDIDFHSNGTDVCIDMLIGGPGSIWSKQSVPRNCSSGSRTESLGSSESPYYGSSCRDQSPASPCKSVVSRNFVQGGKTLGSQHTVGIEDCEFGLEYLALDSNTPTAVWSPFEPSSGHPQTLSGCHTQRRSSVFSGSSTPLLSPSLPDHGIGLEHPLARRIHSDPVSSISWLPSKESLSSFSNSAGYSSSSSLPGSSSVASGSPTESNSSDGQRKSGRDCVVCYESEVIAALVPCGHNLFCMECAIRICERQLPECPACHAPATQAIRIFS